MAKEVKRKLTKKELKSSISVETDAQKQQAAVLELGRKLIKDFDGRDLTAKWMAAYLSELMIAAETDPKREPECRDLILTLWRERRNLPGGDPMERYTRTLEALEVLLKTEQSLFAVFLPNNNREPQEKDWESLVRKLQTRVDFLALTAVKQAVGMDGLREDELLDTANLADPDDQTRVLKILRIVVRDADAGADQEETRDPVLETLEELREVIDDLEAAYSQNYNRNKTTK